MKKLSTILVLALSFVMMASCASQNLTKDQKMAEKSIKKEVRQLKKDGWKVAPGNIALDLQLKEAYSKALEKDDKGYEKFVSGEAMTVGETYDAALFQATNLAKLDLAAKIETEITELIDTKLGNKQLSQKQAASLAESVAASKNLVSQKLGRVLIPVKMYRDLDNGNVEVRTIVYYSHDMAMDVLKQTMREDLEKKADDLSKQLDKILGFWCQTATKKKVRATSLVLTFFMEKADGLFQ